jgi:hypothetical protein
MYSKKAICLNVGFELKILGRHVKQSEISIVL